MGEVSFVGARPGKAGDGHSTSLLEVAQLLNGRPAESYTQVTFKRQELAKSVGKKVYLAASHFCRFLACTR